MSNVKNIFLVDDDPTFIFLTKEIISTTNIETIIEEFSDGQEAIEYLKKNFDNNELLPDIIFLDLHMQIMDGWEFIEEYILLESKIQKKIILYIVSSSISPHDIERAKQLKVIKDFIIKPLEAHKFLEIVNSLSDVYQTE